MNLISLAIFQSLLCVVPDPCSLEQAANTYATDVSPIVLIQSQAMTQLPPALQQAIDAINAADTDAFAAAFAPDGVINDWGRVLRGQDGVRSWARTDAIGAGAQMKVIEATAQGETTHIRFDWRSRVFNGESQAYVTIKDGLISEFRIPSH